MYYWNHKVQVSYFAEVHPLAVTGISLFGRLPWRRRQTPQHNLYIYGSFTYKFSFVFDPTLRCLLFALLYYDSVHYHVFSFVYQPFCCFLVSLWCILIFLFPPSFTPPDLKSSHTVFFYLQTPLYLESWWLRIPSEPVILNQSCVLERSLRPILSSAVLVSSYLSLFLLDRLFDSLDTIKACWLVFSWGN